MQFRKQVIEEDLISNKGIKIKIFDIILIIFFSLFCISVLYPVLYILAVSFSGGATTNVTIFPNNFTWSNYVTMIKYQYIPSAFINSFFRVIVGTIVNLFFCFITAYPLSKRYLPSRNIFTGFIVFTMFFSGGMIPSYLLIKELGLMNSMAALILPGAIPTFSMLLIRNYLMTIPDALEESAKIDGAGELIILFKILLPVTKPILATVALWAIVGHWNAWFDAMLYIRDPNKQVLQMVMRNIVASGKVDTAKATLSASVTAETLQAAVIVITTVPIICVYPFLQKYFVKGIMVGSLKG